METPVAQRVREWRARNPGAWRKYRRPSRNYVSYAYGKLPRLNWVPPERLAYRETPALHVAQEP
jgi:hypothetical protein